MDSPMSSAISISVSLSEVSVTNLRSHNNEDRVESYLANQTPPSESSAHTENIIPECNGKPLFEPGDGDIKLWVNDVCFETHKYLIKRFTRLKNMLCQQASDTVLSVQSDEHGVKDFGGMFKVLYASILEGPFQFDCQTLVSALRIATTYDYPTLRAYAIEYLERVELTAIERIKIAREFELTTWEEPAYMELCARDEAITMEEAGVLGLEIFVRVAGIREKEQRRRGKEVDGQVLEARAESVVMGSRDCAHARTDALHNTAGNDGSAGNVLQSNDAIGSSYISPEPSYNDQGHIDGASTSDSASPNPETDIKPSFVNSQLGDAHAHTDWYSAAYSPYHLRVPGCNCRFLNHDGSTRIQRKCKIEPCIAAAFKNLQIQQFTHTNSISVLESSVKKLAASFIPVPKPAPAHPKPDHPSIRNEVGGMLDALREHRVMG